jgi:hypothetical protein
MFAQPADATRRALYPKGRRGDRNIREMVPTDGAPSNQNRDSNPVPIKDSNELFRTLDQWNDILDGLKKSKAVEALGLLPQSKARSTPPVRRRRKIGGAK